MSSQLGQPVMYQETSSSYMPHHSGMIVPTFEPPSLLEYEAHNNVLFTKYENPDDGYGDCTANSSVSNTVVYKNGSPPNRIEVDYILEYPSSPCELTALVDEASSCKLENADIYELLQMDEDNIDTTEQGQNTRYKPRGCELCGLIYRKPCMLARHICCDHYPWFSKPHTACFICHTQHHVGYMLRKHVQLMHENEQDLAMFGPQYKQLWVYLMMGVLRCIASKLGCVTGYALVYKACGMWNGFRANRQLHPKAVEIIAIAKSMCGVDSSFEITANPPNHFIGLFYYNNMLNLIKQLSPEGHQLICTDCEYLADLNGCELKAADVLSTGSVVVNCKDIVDAYVRFNALNLSCDLNTELGIPDPYKLVKSLMAFTDPELWPTEQQLCVQHDMRFSFGVSPCKAGYPVDIDRLTTLLSLPFTLALGECGLDYTGPTSRGAQKYILRVQLRIAVKLNLPVIIIFKEQYFTGCIVSVDCLDIMLNELPKDAHILLHAFDGSPTDVRIWQRAFPNVVFGISPMLLGTDHHPELVNSILYLRLDEILIESDAPSHPTVVSSEKVSPLLCVVKRIAELKGVSIDEVCNATTHAAARFYVEKDEVDPNYFPV